MSNCTFINCKFFKCEFIDSMSNILIRDCRGIDFITSFLDIISGKCEFINCNGILFEGNILSNANIVVNNTPDLEKVLANIEKRRRLAEEARLKDLELRKSIKYGYKVVNAPVLVKLSFPDEAELVNLGKDKSRANMAMVESVHVINDFGAEGATNYTYNRCEYRVGELVFPDYYDSDPNQDCGHGIHFCKNIEDLPKYSNITNKQVRSIKDQNL